MSWSSLRLFGVVGVWVAVQTGCGGNPSVSNIDPGGTAGTDTGGGGSGATSGGGKTGGLDLGGTENMGEGGTGATSPTDYVCGNKELEPGEFCDDGNTEDGDGCSADCTEVDLDYDCSVVGETCKQVVICGNGVLEGDELCDDGNTVGDDGCSADCAMVEDGFACVRPGKECVAVPVCGNGKRERGEACDDGNADALDGCDTTCQVESGFFCSTPGSACVELVCGDGVRTPDEDCDDGTNLPDDGCDDTCAVRQGWRCNTTGCQPICGDGRVEGAEKCDDGARVSGDGCSSACTIEPFFNCTAVLHQTSVCTTTIACGNNILDPGEVCDPPGTAGCKAGCKSFTPSTTPPMCNNGTVEDGEGCDPPNVGNGCSATCQVEPGWTCPTPTQCFANPRCGDGNVDLSLGEQCENPPAPQVPHVGCGADCKAQPGYTCVGLTAADSLCYKPVCGDGVVQPGEQCDDGNNGAGCVGCQLTAGWACPTEGAACIPKCGDGLKVTGEECDDGNKNDDDGCNKGCKIEPGHKCPTPNMSCVDSVCGDGVEDKGEGCDNGGVKVCAGGTNKAKTCTDNTNCPGSTCVLLPIAGDTCNANCQPEPAVTVGPSPVVNVDCGDGLITGSEECDDGNDTNGDGCNDLCDIERPAGCAANDPNCGWTCDPQLDLPPLLLMQVKYRDFKAGNATAGDGHTDFQYKHLGHVAGITGAPCTASNTATCGRLDVDGKPALVINNQATTGILNANTFGLWFRDSNPNAVKNHLNNTIAMKAPFVRTLPLTQTGGAASEVYVYDSNGNNFYPLDGVANTYGAIGTEVPLCGTGNNGVTNVTGSPACDGCDGTCKAHNFNFTTELRYFFQYKGGETLSFIGDDDVWVYVNGRLAVDMGGLHGAQSGQVVLGDDGTGANGVDSNCSAHSVGGALPDVATCYTAGEQNDNVDTRFNLTKGGVYEIVLFHAERHTTASNFKLTLAGFLAPRSFCESICGDGKVVGDEVCDDGDDPADPDGIINSDTIAGRCNTSCTARNYCGDGTQQTGEACDDGANITLYKTASTPGTACAPGCKTPASCGDGIAQVGQNEKCDKGTAQNTGAYNGCTATCQLGGYCGDNMVNGNETCDLGIENGKHYDSCGYDCKRGPHCGDAIPNGDEECDLGADENGQPGKACNAMCKRVPGCGDGIKQMSEVCDYGQFASTDYGGCTAQCVFGPNCGDGTAQEPYEECDLGTAANTGGYDGCNASCNFGPHCGDGTVQADHLEACDNGFNDDAYKFDDTSCADGCTPPPSCGDGTVQASFELCDNGAANDDDAYEGCTTKCEFGPYCGDGEPNGTEVCDEGIDNVTWSQNKGGCSYDCQPAPYCGDGMRNGPEQCDLGTDANTGEYGTCNADCTFAPRCGDNIRQSGEQCDEGPAGSLSCTPACKRRSVLQ
jgi:fibro-slime domain-containing protein